MSDTFSPRKSLYRFSDKGIAILFKHFGVEPVKTAGLSQRKRTEALFQQYSGLDEGVRQQMEAAMSDIHRVNRSPRTHSTLRSMLEADGSAPADEDWKDCSPYDLSVWAYVNCRNAWEKAARFIYADAVSQSHWTKTRLQPVEFQTIPDTDSPNLAPLADALSTYLYKLDGRGRYAQAHFDLRDGDTEYYFVFLSDWNNIKTECHGGRFDHCAINYDAIEVVLVYHRGTRVLEATFPRGVEKAKRLVLCEVWARLLKGCRLDDEAMERPPHCLDQFMAGAVPLLPDHERRMLDAHVVEVCFTVHGRPGYRHVVTEKSGDLWIDLDRHLNHDALPSCLCRVEYVKIALTLDSSYGTSSRQTLRITPDGDNIDDKSPKVRELLKGLLVTWGIANAA